MKNCCLLVFAALFAVASRAIKLFDNDIASPTVVYKVPNARFQPKCEVTGAPLDLLFVIDSSGSLVNKFQDEIEVIKSILRLVAVGPDATRVALVQYSGRQRIEMEFNEITYKPYMIEAVSKLRHISGITKTGAAFLYSQQLFNTSRGMRGPEVPKLVFLLSDGRTHDYPDDRTYADQLRNKYNVDIWAYGTGDYVALGELVNITRDEKKVVTNRDLHRLDPLFKPWKGVEICEDVPVCIPGSDKPVDLFFLIDVSGSLGKLFKEQMDFVKRIVKPINVHPEAVRVALIKYSSNPILEFDFDDYSRKEPLLRHIDDLTSSNGTTSTYSALRLALATIISPDRGARNESVPKVLIVMTDGHAVESPAPAVRRLRRYNVHLFAIAVSQERFTNNDELLEIAGTEANIFTASMLSEFESKVLLKFVGFGCPGLPGITVNDTEPYVRDSIERTCNANGVRFTVRTKRPFEGFLYANGHDHESNCIVRGRNETTTTITLQQGTCGLVRTESLERDGYNFAGRVTIQFHPRVMTLRDQGFDVDCFYPSKDLNDLPMSIVSPQPRNTPCFYTVHKYGPTHCVALESAVGNSVYHKWNCDVPARNFKYLVHDCYAVDDTGIAEPLHFLDEYGCEIDPVLMETPIYNNRKDFVYQEAGVFKFRSGNAIRFYCKISICDMEEGPCKSMIPPDCSPKALDRRERERLSAKQRLEGGDKSGAEGAEKRVPPPLSERERRAAVSRSGTLTKTRMGFAATFNVRTRDMNLVLVDKLKYEPIEYCTGFS